MERDHRVYVGIDWADDAHQVCAIDAERRVLGERAVKHTAVGLAKMADWIRDLVDGRIDAAAIAIEVPRGAIVDLLLERGYDVYAINPKQLDRFRDRHTVAGAKDDRRDALVLADSLRTDRHCFKHLDREDPIIVELRELVRVDGELRDELVRGANRLREQLHRYFPQALEIVASADKAWFWELLELIPTPAQAAKVRARSVTRILKAHRVRKFTAEDVLSRFRTEPLKLAPGASEAAATHVAFLLPQLKLLHRQRQDCQESIETILERLQEKDDEGGGCEHRDAEVILSLPGVGTLNAATMLAEAPGLIARRDYKALRAQAGIAPVTKQSGKRSVVTMRRSCNGRLRHAVFNWARVSVQRDDHSKAHYERLRSHGHSHGRALRGVADRLLRVLVAMLETGSLYDPELRSEVAA
jgi:transposase